MLKSFVAALSIVSMLWSTAIAEPLAPPVVQEVPIVKAIYKPPTRQLYCLAKVIYFEARNQTEEGKIGVAAVTLNRVHTWKKYRSVCEAVFDGCNFSWTCDGIPRDPYDLQGIHEDTEWKYDLKLAEAILVAYNSNSFHDLTYGATYFHTVASGKPWWAFAKTIVYTVSIDDHVFYRRVI